MDALNSCSWCGRVEGEAKGYEEAGSCFWCEDGLLVGGWERVAVWWMGMYGTRWCVLVLESDKQGTKQALATRKMRL